MLLIVPYIFRLCAAGARILYVQFICLNGKDDHN